MQTFSIRELKPGEAAEAASLIEQVFEKFVAPEFTQEGVRQFLSYIHPQELHNRQTQNTLILVACSGAKIIGILELRNCSHIGLLFTAESWQGRGIAKALLQEALARCAASAPLRRLTVNASRFAVPVYEKLGFTPSGAEQTIDGMRFTPMKKDLV